MYSYILVIRTHELHAPRIDRVAHVCWTGSHAKRPTPSYNYS